MFKFVVFQNQLPLFDDSPLGQNKAFLCFPLNVFPLNNFPLNNFPLSVFPLNVFP